eukprot:255869-Pleurochrysis_carterae.AAC.1
MLLPDCFGGKLLVGSAPTPMRRRAGFAAKFYEKFASFARRKPPEGAQRPDGNVAHEQREVLCTQGEPRAQASPASAGCAPRAGARAGSGSCARRPAAAHLWASLDDARQNASGWRHMKPGAKAHSARAFLLGGRGGKCSHKLQGNAIVELLRTKGQRPIAPPPQ